VLCVSFFPKIQAKVYILIPSQSEEYKIGVSLKIKYFTSKQRIRERTLAVVTDLS